MRWLYKERETSIDGFEFKNQKIDDRVDTKKTNTMNEEFERLYRAMRTYCSRKIKIDEDELCCKISSTLC